MILALLVELTCRTSSSSSSSSSSAVLQLGVCTLPCVLRVSVCLSVEWRLLQATLNSSVELL